MAGPNWKELRDAYGSAEDLPGLLAQLEPDPRSPVWGELWGRVCHQHSTYSASPHVLPFLFQAASAWEPRSRTMPLALAGAIIDAPETVLDGDLSSLAEWRLLALDTIRSGDLSRQDLIYVIQAVLAFERDRLWGHALDRLNDGEFPGACPVCHTALSIVIGQHGFTCAAQDWVRIPDTRRSEIQAIAAGELPSDGRRIYDLCLEAADAGLAEWICYLFGASTCPNCGQSLPLPELIATPEGQ